MLWTLVNDLKIHSKNIISNLTILQLEPLNRTLKLNDVIRIGSQSDRVPLFMYMLRKDQVETSVRKGSLKQRKTSLESLILP